ncbi:ArnT family glycosyltransferase [Fusibacter bizertensis]
MKLKLNSIPSKKRKQQSLTRVDIIGMILLSLYALISLMTIMKFPIVHSDEIWLNGIANEMFTQKSFAVTEPFYDLYPRTIHPFRWLYNGLLIFIRPFLGSSVHSIRILSLAFAVLSLILVYKILKTSVKNTALPLLGAILLGLNIQFVYSSHQGRQEMMLVFFMLLGLYYLTRTVTSKLPLQLSAILILAMGIHPNSFLLGVAFTAALFMQGLFGQSKFKQQLKMILRLAFYTCIGATVYLVVGFIMNPKFITEYLNYGASLGIDQALTGRFEGFYWFFYKLYHQIGGTYDLFNIKPQLVILALILMVGLLAGIGWRFYKRPTRSSNDFHLLITTYSAIWGLLLGILIIGRYNQTSIVFFFPVLAILIIGLLDLFSQKLPSRPAKVSLSMIALLLILFTTSQLWDNLQSYDSQHFYTLSYDAMIETLTENIPQNAVVLGNLNTLEAFEPHHFYDIRNLGFLDTSIEEYITTRNIDYIVLHEEMDYIWKTSPRWDFLYVNLDYYTALKDFLSTHATVIETFENPLYAMRIARYSGTYPWITTIYKIKG